MAPRLRRTGDSPVIAASATIAQAARLMCSRDVAALPVVDGERLLGILTQRDLVRGVADGMDPEATRAAELVAPDAPPSAESDHLMARVWCELPDRYAALATINALPPPFLGHVLQVGTGW